MSEVGEQRMMGALTLYIWLWLTNKLILSGINSLLTSQKHVLAENPVNLQWMYFEPK